MIKHEEEAKKFIDNEPYDEQKLYNYLKHVIDVILRKFYANLIYDEDMRGYAFLQAVEIMNSEDITTNRNIGGYLYKGLRQRIGNKLRTKDKSIDSDLVEAKNIEELNGYETTADVSEDDIDFSFLPELVDYNTDLKKHLKGMLLFKHFVNGR